MAKSFQNIFKCDKYFYFRKFLQQKFSLPLTFVQSFAHEKKHLKTIKIFIKLLINFFSNI
jgi:hypothetical protein